MLEELNQEPRRRLSIAGIGVLALSRAFEPGGQPAPFAYPLKRAFGWIWVCKRGDLPGNDQGSEHRPVNHPKPGQGFVLLKFTPRWLHLAR